MDNRLKYLLHLRDFVSLSLVPASLELEYAWQFLLLLQSFQLCVVDGIRSLALGHRGHPFELTFNQSLRVW